MQNGLMNNQLVTECTYLVFAHIKQYYCTCSPFIEEIQHLSAMLHGKITVCAILVTKSTTLGPIIMSIVK